MSHKLFAFHLYKEYLHQKPSSHGFCDSTKPIQY
jgi:hypothetical protein